jgi:hypothetical protein
MASEEQPQADLVALYPSRIELNRGVRGDVGWSISIRGDNGDEMSLVDRLAMIDAALSIRFRKPNPTLEEQLGESITQASQRPQDSNPDASKPKRVQIAETLDRRVNDRLAAEIEKRGTP